MRLVLAALARRKSALVDIFPNLGAPAIYVAQPYGHESSHSAGNRSRAFMPPGAAPPFIVRYDAGSVPVGQLIFSSPTRSVAEMQDIALNRVRPINSHRMATQPQDGD